METALITGASSGIGAAFAEELAARKKNLVLVARSGDKLQQLASQLQEQWKIQVDVIVQDLIAPEAAKSVFEAVSQKGINIDLLINNAGFGYYGAFAENNLQKQLDMVQLNITVLVELTYLFLSGMKQRRKGGIINVSSIAGFIPLPYFSVYAATKAFVLYFSEAIWAENQDSGVKILAVCPGPTESKFFEVAEFPQASTGSNNNRYVPASEVVRDSLSALEKNQSNVVTGGLTNQLIVNINRFLPREVLTNLVAKQFKK